MKTSKTIILTALLLVFLFGLKAQTKPAETEKKFYYKDTTFEYNGNKYEVSRVVSAETYFKCAVTVTNISDNFIVINPADIFGTTSSVVKTASLVKKMAVIAPKFTKKFTIKLEGKDFRANEINIDITKMQLTGKMVAEYQLTDLIITKENMRQTGPVKWIMKDKKKIKQGIEL